jgi:release factor glutamine methyltransferase
MYDSLKLPGSTALDGHNGLAKTSGRSEKRRIAGCEFELLSEELVFKPTLTTMLLAEQVLSENLAMEKVLDLGCGSGPIAIVLALSGARHIFATDVMASACDLTRRNALLNKVQSKITVLHGNLFEPVLGLKFDLIVDDVSAVAEEVARVSSWFHPNVPLGGTDGTDLTIEMLTKAELHLSPGGHLFFPVLSLSNSSRILAVAREVFNNRLTCVASKLVPFNQELKDNFDVLERLRSNGVVRFEQVRSRLCWSVDIYRADAAV